MPYSIQVTPSAQRRLGRLDAPILRRISAAIDALAEDPRPTGCKKLKGADILWRIRVGDYRILYQIHDGRLVVVIVTVGHRSDVYR